MAAFDQARDLKLIERVRQGDQSAKDDLVEKYLPMVKHIVRKYYASFLEFDDLMQEGIIGLLAAIDEYKPERFNVKFSSFAYMCIIRKVYNVIKQTNGNKHKALNQAISLHTFVNSDETRTMLDLLPLEEAGVDPVDVFEANTVNQRIHQLLRQHLSVLEYTVAALMLEGYSSRGDRTVHRREVESGRQRPNAGESEVEADRRPVRIAPQPRRSDQGSQAAGSLYEPSNRRLERRYTKAPGCAGSRQGPPRWRRTVSFMEEIVLRWRSGSSHRPPLFWFRDEVSHRP